MNHSLLVGWRDRWNQSLLLFLRQRVAARVDVEDLAQETYLRLLRAPDLSTVRNPKAYLLTIAGHVISEWRSRQRPKDVSVEEDESVLVDDCTPEFELHTRVSYERLNETLAGVSAMMRAILLLRLRDEYSYQDIAGKVGITERQVRRYLERGYLCLRRTLEE